MPVATSPPPRVRLHPHGLDLGRGEVVPLISGAIHYWRLAPESWGACLDAMKAMGFHMIDTYVPWATHELRPGQFDFGTKDPRLDVVKFLSMAHERDLLAMVRPGPHVNAELSLFGLPERVVWDRTCQARTPRDHPVMLPMVPVAFPVPSYASEAFLQEAERWLWAVGSQLSRLRFPNGPIVLVQVDNEGALYFRDSPYDQDYHPDAIALFREYLEKEYGTVQELRTSWGNELVTFRNAQPPIRFDATGPDEMAPHLDWMEFQERLVVRALKRMAECLRTSGFDGIPTLHNLPMGEAVTALNAGRITEVVDMVGLDTYQEATPAAHRILMRRVTELVSRCEGTGVPAFGAEIGTGFPPFMPPMDEEDSLYILIAALAYGLRGYNAYMAVERDRWMGAPIDVRGERRGFAERLAMVHRALDETKFHTLRRRAPVRLVVPRTLRRLARITHGFGPITPAAFQVLGARLRASCLEDEGVAALEGEQFLLAFERALLGQGVAFAYAGGDLVEESTRGASWIVVAVAGGMSLDLIERLRRAQRKGAQVTLGPRIAERDGRLRRYATLPDLREFELLGDLDEVSHLVSRRVEEQRLPTFLAEPADVQVCVHENATGEAAAVFVLNPTLKELVARVSLAGVGGLRDVLAAGRVGRTGGVFRVPVGARSARIFAVESGSRSW